MERMCKVKWKQNFPYERISWGSTLANVLPNKGGEKFFMKTAAKRSESIPILERGVAVPMNNFAPPQFGKTLARVEPQLVSPYIWKVTFPFYFSLNELNEFPGKYGIWNKQNGRHLYACTVSMVVVRKEGLTTKNVFFNIIRKHMRKFSHALSN